MWTVETTCCDFRVRAPVVFLISIFFHTQNLVVTAYLRSLLPCLRVFRTKPNKMSYAVPYFLDELSRRPTLGLPFLEDEFDDPDMLMRPHWPAALLSRPYYSARPGRPLSRSGVSHIQDDERTFKVNLDVQQFKPNEVSVKVADGYVVVDGKHEERTDRHGFVSRQFTRRYMVPDNVDPAAITSTLSSDGVLSVVAPKKIPESIKGERPIQIVQTNEPSIKVQQKKDSGEKIEINQ